MEESAIGLTLLLFIISSARKTTQQLKNNGRYDGEITIGNVTTDPSHIIAYKLSLLPAARFSTEVDAIRPIP